MPIRANSRTSTQLALFKEVLVNKVDDGTKAVIDKVDSKGDDVLAALRASGEGWQTRINDALRASLKLTGQI